MIFTQKEAEKIAEKLRADFKERKRHLVALIRYQDKIVAQYGIRRGSKALGHDHIPEQLFITTRQALELARCPLEKDDYFKILRSKGKLP